LIKTKKFVNAPKVVDNLLAAIVACTGTPRRSIAGKLSKPPPPANVPINRWSIPNTNNNNISMAKPTFTVVRLLALSSDLYSSVYLFRYMISNKQNHLVRFIFYGSSTYFISSFNYQGYPHAYCCTFFISFIVRRIMNGKQEKRSLPTLARWN